MRSVALKTLLSAVVLLAGSSAFFLAAAKDRDLAPPKATKSTERAVMSTFYHWEKETSDRLDPDPKPDVRGPSIELSEAEKFTLDRFLGSRKSFSGGVPLLNHSDVQIDFYLGTMLTKTIFISSWTKKINIIRENCQSQQTSYTNPRACMFSGVVSKAFERYLTRLFISRHLWRQGAKFGME